MRTARMQAFWIRRGSNTKKYSGESILVKVGGAGICRTDLQIIHFYIRE